MTFNWAFTYGSPQEVADAGNPNGYYLLETPTGPEEFYINTEDHGDGGWVLVSNVDVTGGNYAQDNGYTAPSDFNVPQSSGDVQSQYTNYVGTQSEDGAFIQVDNFNGASPPSNSWGSVGLGGGSGDYKHIRSYRPDTKGYEWSEIKFRVRKSVGNDGYSNGQGRSDSNSDYELFGNSLDGAKIIAGEPGDSNAEHIFDVITSQQDEGLINYTRNNYDNLRGDGTTSIGFVSTTQTFELTHSLSSSNGKPPLYNEMTDQGVDDEGSTASKWYMWIR
ncbi:hypothetical protein M199_gp032 [Halogranum tailed virus 1]|uniref:Uncharacterized protein n=1 Tax=Halogranum tailed virus 1 TaxID=1273749 RepID=R4TL11_9CAUD|nr:hypothetical protein M199_gp032 [Halogranum tailed virus 1]AGM11362.1 hypothetical protein HGTV1_32 [Halogranum tailed virus 1]